MGEIDGLVTGDDGRARCWWGASTPDYAAYHDDEWGQPVTSDVRLFEKLCLEGFQSGLSWLTILRKREGFRKAFAGFELEAVARFGERDVERLLGDAGIVRHRGKITAAIHNAGCALEVVDEHGSFAAYVWGFEPPPETRPTSFDAATLKALAQTPESKAFSKDLKKRGFKFVGPTTAYAFMQAMGMVNDHLEGCFARPAVEKARARLKRPR